MVGSIQPGLRINSCFLFVIINYQENLRRCYHGWGEGGGEGGSEIAMH